MIPEQLPARSRVATLLAPSMRLESRRIAIRVRVRVPTSFPAHGVFEAEPIGPRLRLNQAWYRT